MTARPGRGFFYTQGPCLRINTFKNKLGSISTLIIRYLVINKLFVAKIKFISNVFEIANITVTFMLGFFSF